MKIDIIGVPLYLGSGKIGADFGPDIIRCLELSKYFENINLDINDLGNINIGNIQQKAKKKKNPKIKFYKEIVKINQILKKEILKTYKNGRFPFVIGGDHSLAFASLSAAKKKHRKLAVVWLDAHPDLNTHKTSPSRNPHGMPLAASLGVGAEDFQDMFNRFLKPADIHLVGVRSIDDKEEDFIHKKKIPAYSVVSIRSRGVENFIEELIYALHQGKYDGVHLSFDLDCLDPKIAPATGTAVNGGFTEDEITLILERLIKSKLLTSMDFVEYNPLLDDDDFSTRKLVIELLKDIFKNFEEIS